jgi:hypothetical protein
LTKRDHVDMQDEVPGADADGTDAECEAIRGAIRLAGHRRVSHGLFLPLRPGLSDKEEFVRDLKAWQRVLPEGSVFTHVTGAKLRGWMLPNLPEQVPVFAATEGKSVRPQRSGLIFSRLVRSSCPDLRSGVPVDSAEEILLRAARDLGLLDLVILTDSARRAGEVDESQMQKVLETTRPGVRMLRQAWSMSDARSESAGETVLRLFHVAVDVPVEPQAVLRDEAGRVIGRADLLIVGTHDVQEYDGDDHRDKTQHRVDLRRERGLSGSAYRRRGYTLDDLLNYPITLMHELDRQLDRPHRMARVRQWQRLVNNSMYSVSGRERVLNRWRRVNTFIDWSRTA